MKINIPDFSLVVLIGASGAGKSSFARKHFLPTEAVSSDFCRALVSDDPNNQKATGEAFALLNDIVRKRLALGRLTVIDATNVQKEDRKPLIQLAREYHALPTAIVLNIPERICHERNEMREDRNMGFQVIHRQRNQLNRGLKGLKRAGFRYVYRLDSVEEVDAAYIERQPLWNDKRDEKGPFDIIGDIHGCADELEDLLSRLGYEQCETGQEDGAWGKECFAHTEGRKAVFLGDIVDRGPRILDSLRIVRNMVLAGHALCVPGNHEIKLIRKLQGRNVQVTHGLDRTLAEIEELPEDEKNEFKNELLTFLDGLIGHYVLAGGRLTVAHAGMREEMQGRGSGAVRQFALYGETTGETDEFGLPVRHDWAAEYRGSSTVVYGHTPIPEPEWINRTVNIDTGCVFGGRLTALRWPEKEFVTIKARQTYSEPVKPFIPVEEQAPRLSSQHVLDDCLDADDVLGKRIIQTRLRSGVTIREESAAAALEVMSRFAVNPKWLIYLPPTMSPCETSAMDNYLEHPAEAFDYYRFMGAPQVVCEEKHMGSRAVVVICRDEAAAETRFGIVGEGAGIIYTRTGRRFFDDRVMEEELLQRLRLAMDRSKFWDRLDTDWACLDCELMPWSAKARDLIQKQYAALGAAAKRSLADAISALSCTAQRRDMEATFEPGFNSSSRPASLHQTLEHYQNRLSEVDLFIDSYRRYCWPVSTVDDLRLAPFHLLATEGNVHVDREHVWHMEILAELFRADGSTLTATPYKLVDVTDPGSMADGNSWWIEMTESGGEGMVVKPLDFIARGNRGLMQPGIKVRGREYLRIIYGPEYTSPQHLERVRKRGLSGKRSLALREFALGIEALERFVRKEPLRRVHECVFGVLALESMPVDPRL